MDDKEIVVAHEQSVGTPLPVHVGAPTPSRRHVGAIAIAALVGFVAGMGGVLLLTDRGEEDTVVATQAGNVTTLSPAAGDGLSRGPVEFVACLRGQGIALADPPTGPSVTPAKQYSSELAVAAWQACRDTFARTSGMPADQMERILAVPDCMAAQGWIVVVMSGPPADTAAYNSAMQKCQPSVAVGGPPGRGDVVACLRAQGLEIGEAAPGSSTVTPTKQQPPETTVAAWQACRDTYVRTSGMPADQMARILAVPDCMAAQGWIIVVMSGPPADAAAFNAAMQKCSPMVPATTVGQVASATRS